MFRIQEAIVVEGRYDKNTLSQLVDTVILETSGFGVFQNAELVALLRRLARTRGLIVLTDSDGAGFLIRGHLKSALPAQGVKHAYIPDVYGKERRKSAPSRERKLGVEGMRPQVILESLRRAGASFEDSAGPERQPGISKADLYKKGLSGRENSAALRKKLLKELELPERLSAQGMLDVLNAIMSREEFMALQL